MATTPYAGFAAEQQSAADDAEASQPVATLSFEDAVAKLTEKVNFTEQAENLERLASFEDERVYDILYSFSKNTLFYVKQSKELVSAVNIGDSYKVTSIMTGKVLDRTSKSGLKKVKSKNSLRRKAGEYLAIIGLKSPKTSLRKNSVYEVIKNVDEKAYHTLKKLAKNEPDEDILEYMKVGIAMWEVDSDDQDKRLNAISVLSNSLIPEVRVKLAELIRQNESGEFIESDKSVRVAATNALKKIDEDISFYGTLENVVFGISTGSILILIAIGLAITFGVLRVINMAHGELMMLGAYTTYAVQQLIPEHIALSIFIAIPLAFLVSAFVGILIERFVVRYLQGRPLDTLLATFGVGLILQQLVRSIFGPNNRPVETPAFMSGSLEFNPIFALTYNRLYIFIFTIIVFVTLVLILKKTRLGLQVRAVSSNRSIAKAMGVRSEWVDALTFGLGSGIAGMAGVALSQVTNVGPNLGQQYIIDSFMVVVFGGVGSLSGTFTSGSILGLLTKFLESWYGAVIASIMVLIFIILFIQKWPRGLFPQKGRAAEAE
jgi:urea transport system permease protein